MANKFFYEVTATDNQFGPFKSSYLMEAETRDEAVEIVRRHMGDDLTDTMQFTAVWVDRRDVEYRREFGRR